MEIPVDLPAGRSQNGAQGLGIKGWSMKTYLGPIFLGILLCTLVFGLGVMTPLPATQEADTKSNEDRTALMWAELLGHTDIVQLLKKAGAKE